MTETTTTETAQTIHQRGVTPDEPGSAEAPWMNRFGEPIYGRVPDEVRNTWQAHMAAITGQYKTEVIRNESAAHAYSMGWYDASKAGRSTAWREAVMRLSWHFGIEYGYATMRFVTGTIGSKQGYAFAWEKALATLPADL